MKISTYNFYNQEAESEIKLDEFIKKCFEKTDSVIKYFKELKANKLDEYLSTFQNRLKSELEEFQYNINLFNLDEIEKNLNILNNYPKIKETILNFICKKLDLPKDLDTIDKKINLLYFNIRKAEGHLSYCRVKAIEDLLGKEECSQIYKQIVEFLINEIKEQESRDQPEDPKKVTRIDSRKFVLDQYKKLGVGNFTLGIYDDYKEIYRFDKCIVHEVLKDFNDPDVAYLSSCYLRDSPSNNEGYIIYMRKTQTLHHYEFCDEFYWNNYVHLDAEQPSLEFTRSMGKD
ncbi:MAG: hypothetical protein H7645_11800 [Candidatus Heimdallarchaeota archaeon]|nr:hypothetical protein [Candidatus Heimdallarchaeota archaeon]MCK4771006.1 hypothetical protein [Candidatus Heimdallarchaeota archaeon]